MQVLTYPIGLLIGLFPIAADLGTRPGPVEVLLDGRPGCVMSGRAPACTVDLGPDPALHLVELVRRGPSGAVVERAQRWVNRPGIEAEVRASGPCNEKTRICALTILWADPARLDPSSLVVNLDGVTVSRRVAATLTVDFPAGRNPQVLTVEAAFPDGRRANFTRLLHGSYPEETEASLQAIPIHVPAGISDDALETSLRREGWPIKAIEKGGYEVDFIVEPRAFRDISWFSLGRDGNLAASALRDAEAIHAIVANESVKAIDCLPREAPGRRSALGVWIGRRTHDPGEATVPTHPELWLRRVYRSAQEPMRRARTADAVAAAGYDLGGSPRRRAVVLIAGAERDDESTFSPEQAQAYLRQIGVPLYVWRRGEGAAEGWPQGPALSTGATLAAEIHALHDELENQRILWLDGRLDPRRLEWPLPEGVWIAGRGAAIGAAPGTRAAGPEHAPDPIYAVAIDPRSPSTIYAGTREGLRISRDAGAKWSPVATGAGLAEIYALQSGLADGGLLLGSSGAIGRSISGGESWALVPTLAVFSFALDPANRQTAFAATRGGIFKTDDAGFRWASSNTGLEHVFPVDVAVDPRDPGLVYTATAGKGVFRSKDGGKTWKSLGPELDRTVVRSIVVDPGNGDLLYAGTDGGVFSSANGGQAWTRTSAGLPRAIVYALKIDPRDPAHAFAGTAAGLFESRNRAASWSRVAAAGADAAITALDVDPASGTIVAGTLNQGVLTIREETR